MRHQLRVYADDVSLVGDIMDLMKEKLYLTQSHDMNVANRCFENVSQVRYFGMTVRN
jgi:hypothetical protein